MLLWKFANIFLLLFTFNPVAAIFSEVSNYKITSYVITADENQRLFYMELKSNTSEDFEIIENSNIYNTIINGSSAAFFFFKGIDISNEKPFVFTIKSSAEAPVFKLNDARALDGENININSFKISFVNKSDYNDTVEIKMNIFYKIAVLIFITLIIIFILLFFIYKKFVSKHRKSD